MKKTRKKTLRKAVQQVRATHAEERHTHRHTLPPIMQEGLVALVYSGRKLRSKIWPLYQFCSQRSLNLITSITLLMKQPSKFRPDVSLLLVSPR